MRKLTEAYFEANNSMFVNLLYPNCYYCIFTGEIYLKAFNLFWEDDKVWLT